MHKSPAFSFPVTSESMRVRIGSLITERVILPSDTLGTLVDDMRSSNLLISASDVKTNGSSLVCPNWMEKRVKDCVGKDDELAFEVNKQMAHVEVYTPLNSTPQEWTLEIRFLMRRPVGAPFIRAFLNSPNSTIAWFSLFYTASSFSATAIGGAQSIL